MTVLFSAEAEEDLRHVLEYISERNPEAARRLGKQILAVIDCLAAGDWQGPEQTLSSADLVRSWPVPPVRIYYALRTGAFWVLRIYHQGRPPL